MLPSATDLTYLLAAADAGNLTKAASQLGIAQPSLSLAIQRLEAELGATLLERSTRGVRLTAAGKVVVQSARELTENWMRIRSSVKASTTEVAGTVSLGCHPAVAVYTLPGFMPALLEQYTQLEIRLEHDLSRRITQSVIDGRLDLGLVINPVRFPDLVMHLLLHDEVRFWQARELAKANRDVCIADLDLLQSQSLMRKTENKGLRFRRVIPTSKLEVVAALTAAGVGVGILPERVATSYAPNQIKPVPGMPTFSDSLFLIYRPENRQRESIKAVVQAIRSSLR